MTWKIFIKKDPNDILRPTLIWEEVKSFPSYVQAIDFYMEIPEEDRQFYIIESTDLREK